MNISVTLQYGPIETEISGDNSEEVQRELLEFIDFLNENEEDLLLDVSLSQPPSETESVSEPSGEDDGGGHPLAPIARELGISLENLDNVVYVDPDLEEDPQLLLEADEYGERTVNQQRIAAYVLLYVWDECYGNDRMDTSKLNDIFALAGLSTNNLYRAWRDEGRGKFDPRGQGPSASVALTGVGKRTAKTVLQDLVGGDS